MAFSIFLCRDYFVISCRLPENFVLQYSYLAVFLSTCRPIGMTPSRTPPFTRVQLMQVYRLKELLEMAGTTRAKLRVKAKTKVQKCLLCDDDAVDGKRGLCAKHYNQFVVARRKLAGKKRSAFDAEQVRAGRILEPRRGRHPSEPNPFEERTA